MKKFTVTVVALALFAQSAFADVTSTSENFYFKSTQEIEMNLNLQVESEFPNNAGGTTVSSENIELMITNHVSPSDKFRAVLTTVCNRNVGDVDLEFSQQVDLKPFALKNGVLAFRGVFEKAQSFGFVDYRGYGSVNCQNELSVVKNGMWQVDPINGTTSFKFQLNK